MACFQKSCLAFVTRGRVLHVSHELPFSARLRPFSAPETQVSACIPSTVVATSHHPARYTAPQLCLPSYYDARQLCGLSRAAVLAQMQIDEFDRLLAQHIEMSKWLARL
eukprot:300499-Pleurochrysis_carterae.AAC.2